jgi:hypothetical protein
VGGSENTHFTPWLATHIDVLGDAIGLELRVLEADETTLVPGQHIEVQVGDYWLDIRALDVSGRIVAIENQYGIGDHKHLGQLLTYASGIGADVLVWVAEAFSDAHLQTLRWLNERTDDQCGVFAVQARFLQIGTSPPAPSFELAVEPSEWARNQRRSAAAQRDRWSQEQFLEALVEPTDRARVEKLFDLTEGTAPEGHTPHFWYGAYPGGAIFLHPFGLRYAPISLAVNAHGRAVVYGLWNNWTVITGHEAFRHVASALGQSHTDRASARLLGEIDIDELWSAVLLTAREINEPDG